MVDYAVQFQRLIERLNVPFPSLDSVCHNEHLLELAREMTGWKTIAPWLGFYPPAVENIDEQRCDGEGKCQQMLMRWKQFNSSNATYRELAMRMIKSSRINLAEFVVLASNRIPSQRETVSRSFYQHSYLSPVTPVFPSSSAGETKYNRSSPNPPLAFDTSYPFLPASVTPPKRELSLRPSTPLPAPTPPTTSPCPDRVAQVMAEISILSDSYSDLTSETRDELSDRENCDPSFLKKFRDRLFDLPIAKKVPHDRFFHKNEDELLRAKDVEKVFAILRRYCSYSNYDILREVVRKFCAAVLQRRMKEYIISLEIFEKATTIDVYLAAESAGPTLTKEFMKMAITINKPPNECTLYEVRKLKEEMAEKASLHPYCAYLHNISASSVKVELAIHVRCVEKILAVFTPQFLFTHHLSNVMLGDETPVTMYNVSPRPERVAQVMAEINILSDSYSDLTSETRDEDELLRAKDVECIMDYVPLEKLHPHQGRQSLMHAVRPLPHLSIPIARFRLCGSLRCRQGDMTCTFAHCDLELKIWNQQLSEQRRLQSSFRGAGQLMRPLSQQESHTPSTFYERIKEPLDLDDLKQPLSIGTYKEKFHKLLCWEEKEHISLLQDKCNGVYPITVTGHAPPGTYQYDPDKDYGYIDVGNGDIVAYATQASEAVVLVDENMKQVEADILKDDNTQNRIYISFDKYHKLSGSNLTNFESQFEVKHFYFDNLHDAVNGLSEEVIRRLLPQEGDFDRAVNPGGVSALHSVPREYHHILHLENVASNKRVLYQVALSCKSGAPPALIAGPFGTGKTCFLSSVALCFIMYSPARVLICVHHQATADTILNTYFKPLMTNKRRPLPATVIRIVSKRYNIRPPDEYCIINVETFKEQRKEIIKQQRLVIITTLLTALQLRKSIPVGFFTHILIDEGAQVREPEAIAPLCLANRETKIIIAGDPHQVGPSLLVLGEEAREHGLKTSLLQRLRQRYRAIGGKTRFVQADMMENYRCHKEILKFASDMCYKSSVIPSSICSSINIPYGFQYPLVFVCTSIEETSHYFDCINEKEANILMNTLNTHLLQDRANHKKKRVCVMSSSRGQVTVLRSLNTSYNLPISVKPTYDIQGQEYDVLYISTCEATYENGETTNPTKSVCDKYIFNTAITRARSLIISFGNPSLLLSIEKHMQSKYSGGHCWSQYMKTCLHHNTFIVPASVAPHLRGEQFKRRLSGDIHAILSGAPLRSQSAQSLSPQGVRIATISHGVSAQLNLPTRLVKQSAVLSEKGSTSSNVQRPARLPGAIFDPLKPQPNKVTSSSLSAVLTGQHVVSKEISSPLKTTIQKTEVSHQSGSHKSESGDRPQRRQRSNTKATAGKHSVKQSAAEERHNMEFPTLEESRHINISKRERRLTESSHEEVEMVKNTMYFLQYSNRLDDLGIFEGPLTLDNYKERFHRLLCLEEKEHMSILSNRCNGTYFVEFRNSIPKEDYHTPRVEYYKYHHYGIIKGSGGNDDNLAYAKQAGESANTVIGENKLSCDFLPPSHPEGIVVGFCTPLKSLNVIGRQIKCQVCFELKHSYFNRQHEALQMLRVHVMKSILPSDDNIMNEHQYRRRISECNLNLDYNGQMQALQAVLKPGSDPVIIAGPFGTGKTRVLARAAYELVLADENYKVLICTHHQTSADTFIGYFQSLKHENHTFKAIEIVRIETFRYHSRVKDKNPKYFCSVRNALLCNPRITVSTLGLSHHLRMKNFTHILIDEAAQTRETEAIIPLQHAGPGTKIVLAGDHYQVGPDVLVLGEMARKHGLKVSLLERLHNKFVEMGKLSCVFSLLQNYRSHTGLLMLPSSLFYQSTLQCNVPDSKAHPLAPFPLVFVCSSIDNTNPPNAIGTDRNEAVILANMVKKYVYDSWPKEWGEYSNLPEKVCVMTPSATQKRLINREVLKVARGRVGGAVTVLKAYEIQGCEFTAVFMGTCETTDGRGVPNNTTKTIINHYVFNTALTRAQYLFVAVGNPLQLLDREAKMQSSSHNHFPCWKEFLKRCVECKSFYLPDGISPSQRQQFTDVLQQQLYAESSTPESHFHDTNEQSDSILTAYKKKFEKIPECKQSKLKLTRVDGTLAWKIKNADETEEVNDKENARETTAEACNYTLRMITYSKAEAIPQHPSKRKIQIRGKGNVRGALHDDIVEVTAFTDSEQTEMRGKILNVVKRCHKQTVICRPHTYNPTLFYPVDKKYPIVSNLPKLSKELLEKKDKNIIQQGLRSNEVVIFNISSLRHGTIPEIKNVIPFSLAHNMIFVVKILQWNPKYRFPLGAVIHAVPKGCSSFHAERLLMIEHNVEYEEEGETMKMESNNNITGDASMIRAFTIDPEDAVNLDDALSLCQKQPNMYHLSVHIVNTTREIAFGGDVDKRAAIRGESVYGGEKVMNIFPSHTRQKLSLTPNRVCDVISISGDVHISEHSVEIKDVQIKESKIISCKKLSYHSAQAIMNGARCPYDLSHCVSDYDSVKGQPNLRDTLKLLLRIAHSLRIERLGELGAKSYEVDNEKERECWETHLLVEEMMIWANNVVAGYILEAFPDCALLRRQAAPNEEELEVARNTHCSVARYSHRYSKHFTDPRPEEANIIIAMSTLNTIKQAIKEGNERVVLNLLTDDSLFPQLNATSTQLRRIQQKAEYVATSGETDDASYHHYSLCLPFYTHFTSPLRRYADVVVQRMVKAKLTNISLEYSQEDVQSVCHRLYSTGQNAKSFEKAMKSLRLAIQFAKSSQLYEAVVTKSGETEVELSFLKNELKVLSGKNKIFKVRHLLSKRGKTESDSVMYSWSITMISADKESSFPYDYEDLSFPTQSDVNDETASDSTPNVTMSFFETIRDDSPMLKVVTKRVNVLPTVASLSPASWRCIKKFIKHPSKNSMTQVQDTLDAVVVRPKPSIVQLRVTNSPVVRSKITRTMNVYDLINIWMTWSTRDSMISPALQMIEITPFFRICLQHNSHPAECFSDSHLQNASKECYSNLDEYVDLWGKVLLAEASERSIRDSHTAMIYNAKIDWGDGNLVIPEEIGATLYELQGPVYLHLPLSILNGENPFFKLGVGDMACVRYGTSKNSKIRAVFHFVITGKNEENEYVTLESFGNDNIRMSEEMKPHVENEKCEIQVIYMSPSYRRVYRVLLSLRESKRSVHKLLKVVAIGKDVHSLKKLPQTHALSSEPLYGAPNVKTIWSGKGSLNNKQLEALKLSLKQQFLLIQGPPGTGKSETGAHIAYTLAMCNRIRNSNECVLYCAPTNKAVDVVLRKLDQLQSDLKILRVYGKSTEKIDFPGLHLKGDTFEASQSGYQCPKWAHEYALHCKIRNINCDESNELNEIEKNFKDDCNEGEFVAGQALHVRRKKLIESLQNKIMNDPFDIVLCTCNEAASKRLREGFTKNERTKETRFLQCVMDESGMAYEPETIVPMRLCNHVILLGDHQQLQPVIEYKPARENGLTTSLFERYAKSKKYGKPVMLTIQYRMHEEICSFPSKHFYDDELETDRSVKIRQNKESQLQLWPRDPRGKIMPIIFCDIVGRELPAVQLSKSNPDEAKKAVQIALVLIKVYAVKPAEIALMTPYKAQKKCLLELAKDSGLNDVAVATITESQGDEYGIVILSTVRSQPLSEIINEDYVQPDRSWILENLGFLTDQHEMNVGITRSKYGLIIIGNKTLLRYDDNWKELITHYEHRNCVVCSSHFPSDGDLRQIPELAKVT